MDKDKVFYISVDYELDERILDEKDIDVGIYQNEECAIADCVSDLRKLKLISKKDMAEKYSDYVIKRISVYQLLLDFVKRERLSPILFSLDDVDYCRFSLVAGSGKMISSLLGVPIKREKSFPKLYIKESIRVNGTSRIKNYVDFPTLEGSFEIVKYGD